MSASSFEALLADDGERNAARLLGDAARLRTPCDPVKPLLESAGIDAAYAVQHLLTENALANGRRIVGRKIGLTSAAVQKQLGVDQPDFGVLFDDMEYGNAQEVPLSRLIQPKVEAEIAFVLERDLDAERPSLGHVLNAIGYALPAIEIVDSRVRDWKIGILDTIADNASSGLYVLGGSPKKSMRSTWRCAACRWKRRANRCRSVAARPASATRSMQCCGWRAPWHDSVARCARAR